jgi:hypothetical protein
MLIIQSNRTLIFGFLSAAVEQNILLRILKVNIFDNLNKQPRLNEGTAVELKRYTNFRKMCWSV